MKTKNPDIQISDNFLFMNFYHDGQIDGCYAQMKELQGLNEGRERITFKFFYN